MFTTEQLQSLVDNGGVVVDRDGDKVGKVSQVYLDDDSGRPEWVTTKTGLIGGAQTFAPLGDATAGDNEVRVAHDKATINRLPVGAPASGDRRACTPRNGSTRRRCGLRPLPGHPVPA